MATPLRPAVLRTRYVTADRDCRPLPAETIGNSLQRWDGFSKRDFNKYRMVLLSPFLVSVLIPQAVAKMEDLDLVSEGQLAEFLSF
jgi:hypothetical protein